MPRLNQAQFAAVIGVSKQQVNKLVLAGILTLDSDGKIDEETGKAAILAAGNLAHSATRSTAAARLSEGATSSHESEVLPEPPQQTGTNDAFNSFQLARTLKEKYAALTAQLEYEQLRGILVLKTEVNRQAFTLSRAAQREMMAIPDRISALLAAETDPGRVHTMLTRELCDVAIRLIEAARAWGIGTPDNG